ncbi:MAG: metallophosphoesterase [Methanothrix sp.]
MNDIRYVCLSDMHLGEEDSLLTEINGNNVDPLKASSVMVHLVNCLRELISKNEGYEKPNLILNGDILELALSECNTSAMIFERFMELVMAKDKDLFDKIIYVPGNHDHHLWEQARETQYVEYIYRNPDQHLDPPWHHTKMFLLGPNQDNSDKNLVTSYLLDKVLERRSKLDIDEDKKLRDDIKIIVAYPNFGILSDSNDRCVIFHHGHFVESKYCIMSKLKADLLDLDDEMPRSVQLIESENFAWIDFLWSALGRSGEVGALTETLYEHMLDREQMNVFISRVAKNLAKKYDLTVMGDWLDEAILKNVLDFVLSGISKGERGMSLEPLGEEAQRGMALYLKAVKNQITDELQGTVPSELAFVFGHTHKSFLGSFNIEGFGKPVAVYNTGGWVVDKVERDQVFGGAVLLLDEKLDACLLEMYRELDDPDKYRVQVRHLDDGTKQSPFYNRILSLVNGSEKPWRQFSNIAHLEVTNRADRLDIRLKSL